MKVGKACGGWKGWGAGVGNAGGVNAGVKAEAMGVTGVCTG